MASTPTYIVQLDHVGQTVYIGVEPAKLIPSWPVTMFVGRECAHHFTTQAAAEVIAGQHGVYDARVFIVEKGKEDREVVPPRKRTKDDEDADEDE